MFNWKVQSNSWESVINSKYELKSFAILMFWGKISLFSFKANFELPQLYSLYTFSNNKNKHIISWSQKHGLSVAWA